MSKINKKREACFLELFEVLLKDAGSAFIIINNIRIVGEDFYILWKYCCVAQIGHLPLFSIPTSHIS